MSEARSPAPSTRSTTRRARSKAKGADDTTPIKTEAEPTPALAPSRSAKSGSAATPKKKSRSVAEASTDATAQRKPSADAEAKKASQVYWKKIQDRTLFTLLMIGGFIGLLLMGPAYMILLVLLSETLVYREVAALFNIPHRPHLSSVSESEEDDALPQSEVAREELWSKTLSWYFFAVANFFLYGESLIYYFKHIVYVDTVLLPFVRHHRFISFMLYVFGFMAFVTNLKGQNLKRQFGLFCWVHMSLLLIVLSSHFLVNNILEGMIWFFLPASLVVCNDVWAYICGMLFGRTPLISLSPKKTVEGFVGAFFVTEVFAWLWAALFQRYQYMICPVTNLGVNAFSGMTCEPNPVFIYHSAPLPGALSHVLSTVFQHPITHISWTHFQFHALVMAAFASLVAPFGGFFASGFKRAFNIKDFGDSIPGHGGLTDRFDCQFLMGLFSYVYYSSIIRESRLTVAMAMQLIILNMTNEAQHELLGTLSQYLARHPAK